MQRQVRLLGTPAIVDDEGRGQPVRGHQAWALLARIVLAQRPLSRQKLAAELFPESVDPLGAVRWGLAALRKALNASDCLVGDPVEPRFPSGTEIDLRQLELDTFDVGQAGDLLEGMEPQCSPEFSVWLLAERARIRSTIDGRIRREVMRALAVDDPARALRLSELAVRRDIYNEGAHVLLVRSLPHRAMSMPHSPMSRPPSDCSRMSLASGPRPRCAARRGARWSRRPPACRPRRMSGRS